MRLACCNDLFREFSLERFCDVIASFGFAGIELDPATVFDDPEHPSRTETTRVLRAVTGAGLVAAGFHWVLRKPAGLNLLSEDEATRARTWSLLHRLTGVADDLGARVITIGSGNQRDRGSMSRAAAAELLARELQDLCKRSPDSAVMYCLEPLPVSRTNTLNTLSEVADVVEQANHARIRAVFDFHNCVHEGRSWTELIRTYHHILSHVHLNDADGGPPAATGADFRTPLRELLRTGYEGWISLEPFRLEQPPMDTLAETVSMLRPLIS